MLICMYSMVGILCVGTIVFLILYAKRISWWFWHKSPQARIESYTLHRFAVVIPARNEGKTILALLDSLQKQTYDHNLFDVYIIVKEENDPAIEWISSVYPSAIVYVDEEQTTKGHALNYGMQRICEHHPNLYDGFLIIDADCVLDSMFLCEMNRAFGSGRDVYNSKLVVKNYLNSSKSANSWASQCNGLIWTLMSELGNRAKSELGIVTMTLGTGLLLRSSLVKQWNGWPFLKTLTEDMELQRCCALHHYSCEYVSYAVCYVEEATSLHATNLRRNRWMTGVVDCDRLYDEKLKEAKKSSQDKNNFYAIHSLYYVYFYVGFLLILFLSNIILGCVCAGLKFSYFYVFFIVSFLSFANLYLGLFIMTIRCMWVDRKYLPMSWMRRIWISLTHPFYYMGYIGIMTKIFTFKRTKEWKKIARVEFQESEA